MTEVPGRGGGPAGGVQARCLKGAAPPDLQDMSPIVLTCDGPDELFDRHKLVLSVSSSDSRRVRVFHARGEWLPGPIAPAPVLQAVLPPFPVASISHQPSRLSEKPANSRSICVRGRAPTVGSASGRLFYLFYFLVQGLIM